MTRWYCTLEALKDELGETTTASDKRLARYIANASRAIEDVTGRTFIPVTDTKYFDAPRDCGRLFLAYEDLLTLTTLTDNTGEIISTYYWLYPLNMDPKHSVVLNTDDLGRCFEYDDREKAITILGQWGYCNDTVATGLTLAVAISSTTATTIVLSGAGCQVGWTLLIDSEAMHVSSVSGNVATVERGGNGTTAATHLISTAVSRYVVPADIEQACLEMALYTNNTRAGGGISQEKIGEYSITYSDTGGTSSGAGGLDKMAFTRTLRRYQRIGL